MSRLCPAVLVLLLALAFAPGAASAATSPPQLAALRSVRETTLLSFDGRALQVCQREWQSWNRVHGVCHDLATATVYDQRFVEGTVVEFVLFDGTHYERVNDQSSWSARPDESFAPDQDLNEAFFLVVEQAQLTRLPDAIIAGAPAAHYQYWVLDEARNAEAGGQKLVQVKAYGHREQPHGQDHPDRGPRRLAPRLRIGAARLAPPTGGARDLVR